MSDLRTPLSKAKGLGAAHEGTHHFWVQRLTALALIPLVLWFGFAIAALPEANYANVVAWLDSPFNAVMLALFLIAGFYHASLGVQVILEDYVSTKWLRLASIIAVQLGCFFFAALGVFSVIKISLGA